MCLSPKKWDVTKEAVVKKLAKAFANIEAAKHMTIATTCIMDDYICHIPKRKEDSLAQMQKHLAAEYHANKTCPVTSGIFLRIVAEAAYEEYQKGKAISKITPFWRMINEQMPAAKKLTFGTTFLLSQRKKEGLPTGKKKPTKKMELVD